MTAGNDVGFIKQFIAYFTRNECPKTFKVVLKRFQLLHEKLVFCGCLPLAIKRWGNLTSSDLLSFDVSSNFFGILDLRLSLLDGRAGLSASATLPEGRDTLADVPLTLFVPDAMLACCGELLLCCEEAMGEDELFWRAEAAGEVGGRVFIEEECRGELERPQLVCNAVCVPLHALQL